MEFFSIKMRSSSNGLHISGHERIVTQNQIKSIINNLYERGSRKNFDLLNIKIEKIKKPIKFLPLTLKLKDFHFKNYEEANNFAVQLIHKETGIKKEIIEKIIKQVHQGAGKGKNMRGAMIVNTKGERLEKDKEKGIRTSTVDYKNRDRALNSILKRGLTERTLDALALSTKNLNYPYILAEYCISDEPDYLTGYVATKDTYYRLTPLKGEGSIFGGRVYFVSDDVDIEKLYIYLQSEPVLIEDVNV